MSWEIAGFAGADMLTGNAGLGAAYTGCQRGGKPAMCRPDARRSSPDSA